MQVVTASAAALLVAVCLTSSVSGFSTSGGFAPLGTKLAAVVRCPRGSPLRSPPSPRSPGGRPGLRSASAITDMVFEPQAPPLGTIVSMIGTVSLAGYWWLVFVPSERRDLAANKNKGGLNGYLDKLAEAPEGERKLERWFYSEWMARRKNQQQMLVAKATSQSKSSGESFETVLARLQEEQRVENIANSNAMPSFLSPDNPVLVAGTLALFGVLVAAGKH